MRTMMAALPPNPWQLAVFAAVVAVFVVVLALSLKLGRPDEIKADSELPFKD